MRKTNYQNIIFLLYLTLCKPACIEMSYKSIYKDYFANPCLSVNLNYYFFLNAIFLFSFKELFSNPIPFMQANPYYVVKIYPKLAFILKIYFLLVWSIAWNI
jgi:hypothetical protein